MPILVIQQGRIITIRWRKRNGLDGIDAGTDLMNEQSFKVLTKFEICQPVKNSWEEETKTVREGYLNWILQGIKNLIKRIHFLLSLGK